MKTQVFLLGLVMIISLPSNSYGQFNGRQSWVLPPVDPRERRLLRERAVLYAGPAARGFVESLEGDDAALALLTCSKSVAAQFALFHVSGGFGRLPRRQDYLRVIAQSNCRDPVALWVMQHANELYDQDSTDVFLASPLEFSLALKSLTTAAIERRTERLSSSWPANTTVASRDSTKSLAWILGLIGLGGLVAWRMRHRFARDLPA